MPSKFDAVILKFKKVMVHKSRRYTESSYYGFVFLLLRGAEWMGVSPVHIYAQHLNFIYYLNLLTD